jgi:putative transposase
VGKQYQTRDAEASTPELSIPGEVSVALAEIAESAKEGLLALAVGAGLQVMATLMEESVVALAGPKHKHNPDRAAVRHGHEQGSVTLGGRRVAVQRPRVRAADGSGELPVAAYQLFSSTELLGRLALERMLSGLSTRRYSLGLEPVGTQVEQTATGTSKSAVSRRFVAMTHTALAELLTRDLSTLDLVCLLVDGVHFGEHTCVVALGIDLDGTKHPLALVEGSTENATLARELLVGLRERGLDVTRPILCVLDGAKALRRAVLDVFDRPVLARCQQHKIRNVRDKLPQRLGGPVERRMRAAYHAASALDAEAQLLTLARELDKTHPGAAASLAGGPDRDPDGAAAGRAADPGPHAALHQPHRVDDLHLPRPCRQRQTLAGRADGAALVRRRDGRGRQAVPPRQRLPTPAGPARRPGGRGCQGCHRVVRGSRGGGSGLTLIGAATEVQRNSGHPQGARSASTMVSTRQFATVVGDLHLRMG